MYCKIIVYFKSNDEGIIYEETATAITTDENDYLFKRKILIDKWFSKICYFIDLRYFNFSTYNPKESYDFEFECKLNYINRTIEDLNKIDLMKNSKFQDREFTIQTVFFGPELEIKEIDLYLDKN